MVNTAPVRRLPRVIMTFQAWERLFACVRACPVEVSGLGSVKVDGDVITIDQIFVLRQRASLHGVDVDSKVYLRFLDWFARQGGDLGSLRVQWHSHVRGVAWPSHVDQALMNAYTGKWRITLIFNQFGECYAQIDVYQPERWSARIHVEVALPDPSAPTMAKAFGVVKRLVRNRYGRRHRPVTPPPTVLRTAVITKGESGD